MFAYVVLFLFLEGQKTTFFAGSNGSIKYFYHKDILTEIFLAEILKRLKEKRAETNSSKILIKRRVNELISNWVNFSRRHYGRIY